MKYGLTLPPRRLHRFVKEAGPASLLRLARTAEECGYDFLCIADHIILPADWAREHGENWFDPFTTLAFIAAGTRKIRLLTDVVVLPYRSPFAVAKAIATIDVLSHGRVIFGTASGYNDGEFSLLRIPFHERGKMTDEYLEIIQELWTNPHPSYHGKYFTFDGAVLAPRPVQTPRPPIWIGGNSRAAAARAAKYGEGWTPFRVTPEEVKDRLTYAGEILAGKGKEHMPDVAIPTTRVRFTPTAVPPDDRRLSFAGTASQLIDFLLPYRDAGATYFKAGFVGYSVSEFTEHVEQFAREVMPAFSH